MTTILTIVPDHPGLQDVPGMLRQLAEDLENGRYGDLKDPDFVIRFSGVLRVTAQEPIVFGWGQIAHPAITHMDLCAGAHQIMMMKSPGR